MTAMSGGDKTWSSPTLFVFAAVGAAVGLGNIWKFPYIVGSNGGGLFVVVYLLCVAFVALPVLIGELMLGRLGHHSPPVAMQAVAEQSGASARWSILGWLGLLASLLIASFYAVISGWTLAYIPLAASEFGATGDIDPGRVFADLLADPTRMVAWFTVFLVATMFIIARGLHRGIETTVRIMMPLLIVLLLGLTIFACVKGDLGASFNYLFSADLSKVTPGIVAAALGQAFFSIGLAAGLMMTYGAYLPRNVSIVRSAAIIVAADTAVALAAGLMVFPLVFSNGLDPAEGPGLIFVTMPNAFLAMQGGVFFGVLFFVLLALAAVTSLIAAIEPTVAYSEDRWKMPRSRSCMIIGVALWLVGLLSVFSFNLLSGFRPVAFIDALSDLTLFGLLDYLTANVMLPLSGIFLAIFVGWKVPARTIGEELSFGSPALARCWLLLLRYVAPAGIGAVFVTSLV